MLAETSRQLLILDLDETLIYGAHTPIGRNCDFRVGPYHIYRRPHLAEFLTSIQNWFEIAIWSSAGADYVQGIVENVFPEPSLLRFVWSRDRCTPRFDAEYQAQYWVKNLTKVQRLGIPLERVLMIDDSPEKLEMQYGNLLLLHPYLGASDDRELQDVLPYLCYLRGIDDLRRLEKRNWRSVAPMCRRDA